MAAYRIAQEALTNVARHAGADHCSIKITIGTDLELVIEDDGRGLPEKFQSGVGLHSMRERADELGGRFEMENRATGGLRIYARVPLPTV